MSDAPPTSTFAFETTDAFSWSGFAGKLEAFLLKEVEFVEGSLVVSLNAAEEFKKQLGGFYPGGYRGYSSLSNLAKKIQEIESFAK